MTSAWFVFAVALLLITSFSVLVGKCIRYGLGDPEHDLAHEERQPVLPPAPAGASHPLRLLIGDEERELLDLTHKQPATYSNGTTDRFSRDLDVIADALAAPGPETPDAA